MRVNVIQWVSKQHQKLSLLVPSDRSSPDTRLENFGRMLFYPFAQTHAVISFADSIEIHAQPSMTANESTYKVLADQISSPLKNEINTGAMASGSTL